MNDPNLEKFIAKATGKTIGRCSKVELATMFYNSYAELVKYHQELTQGYYLYKEKEDKLNKIKEEMKDLDTIPTSVVTTIIEEVAKEEPIEQTA